MAVSESALRAANLGGELADASEPLRVLVVDDDEFDRVAVRRLLQSAGFRAEIVECADGKHALTVLAHRGFDCVLLDYQMPEMNGLAVIRALRRDANHTPVVVLTGFEDAETAVELIKSGATDYLPKSAASPERLGRTIRQALRLFRVEEQARQAAEALRASEEFNRRLLASSEDWIQVIDLEGRLVSTSPGGLRRLGWSPVDAHVGESWVGLWAERDREAASLALDDARQERVGRFVGFCPSRAGEPIWWDVVVTPIDDAHGRPERLLAVARDVTAAKQREKFEQQLIGIVSHDLRNPMQAIYMAAELLERRGSLDERAQRAVGRIRSSSDRAMGMIRDLLDFTRARIGGGIPLEVKSADLSQIAAQVIEEVRTAHPGSRIELVAPGSASGRCDPDRMAQVIANLVTNAVQYSPAESTVKVELDEREAEFVIRVHNVGAPIPADQLPLIFEPLQRAVTSGDNAMRSIGLGLYIVKQIVEGHGGAVAVRSTAAEGTTFEVRLPKTGEGACARRPAAAPQPS